MSNIGTLRQKHFLKYDYLLHVLKRKIVFTIIKIIDLFIKGNHRKKLMDRQKTGRMHLECLKLQEVGASSKFYGKYRKSNRKYDKDSNNNNDKPRQYLPMYQCACVLYLFTYLKTLRENSQKGKPK